MQLEGDVSMMSAFLFWWNNGTTVFVSTLSKLCLGFEFCCIRGKLFQRVFWGCPDVGLLLSSFCFSQNIYVSGCVPWRVMVKPNIQGGKHPTSGNCARRDSFRCWSITSVPSSCYSVLAINCSFVIVLVLFLESFVMFYKYLFIFSA